MTAAPTMRLRSGDGALELVCVKCTHARVFRGADRRDCEVDATQAGWIRKQGKIICPRCAK